MVYIFLADGFEEIEAITPIDVLRRADIEIKIVSIYNDRQTVKGAHGIVITSDININAIDLETADMIILPGGLEGVNNLSASSQVNEAIDYMAANGKYIAAICAAPTILADKGLLSGKKATCYPSMAENIIECGAKYKNVSVCRDGNIVTSAGAGTAGDFAFAIVKELDVISRKADNLRISMVYDK